MPLPIQPWDREAAEKALALENEWQIMWYGHKLVIRFPDPELSKEIVKAFHPMIDTVHFQSPPEARFCHADLVKGANIDKVIEEIEKIEFGGGKLKAERKLQMNDEPVAPESIDPYTLYVGNLPATIRSEAVIEIFPTAHRITIGYSAEIKYTRYALVSFQSSKSALEAFNSAAAKILMNGCIIILRFRRLEETIPDNVDDDSDDDEFDDDDDDDNMDNSDANDEIIHDNDDDDSDDDEFDDDDDDDDNMDNSNANDPQRMSGGPSFAIRFPDPKLSNEIVKTFHPMIDAVQFKTPYGARFCFARLVEGANINKVIAEIEETQFGLGKLNVERI